MANRTKVTQQKRARERAKQERQQEKTRRREEVKTRKANEPHSVGGSGEDPDIAGIVPGLMSVTASNPIGRARSTRTTS